MATSTLDARDIAKKLYRYDRVHVPLQSAGTNGNDALAQFREQGFVAVENVISPAEVADAIAGLSFLIAGGNKNYKGIEYEQGVEADALTDEQREHCARKVWLFVEHEPRLKRLAEHPSILAIVRKLIGGEPNLIQDMALLKPPRGREKPWHQDSAYFLFEPAEKVVGAWIALDPALVENGCMHVIPASHLQGPVPHYHDRDCQIADDTVAMERDVCVPLRPGGALFFSSLLHHGTPPNDSPLRRRALQFHYAASDCRKVSAEEKGTIFFDAGGAAACMHGRKISDRK